MPVYCIIYSVLCAANLLLTRLCAPTANIITFRLMTEIMENLTFMYVIVLRDSHSHLPCNQSKKREERSDFELYVRIFPESEVME